jgi:hypothetical protein
MQGGSVGAAASIATNFYRWVIGFAPDRDYTGLSFRELS